MVDSQTQKPLAEICLNLYREDKTSQQDLYSSTVTDAKGRYLLVPENGVYNLSAIIAGRETIIRKGILVTDDQPNIRQTIELKG